MPTKINDLSIALTIGTQQLILQTDTIPSAKEVNAATTTVATQLKDLMLNLSFRMEKGKVITVALEDFFTSIGEKIGAAGLGDLQTFFREVAGGTKGIYVDLWDLSFTTGKILKDANAAPTQAVDKGKLSFAFRVRVTLTKAFYDNIHIPAEIQSLISINSLGLGLAYYTDS